MKKKTLGLVIYDSAGIFPSNNQNGILCFKIEGRVSLLKEYKLCLASRTDFPRIVFQFTTLTLTSSSQVYSWLQKILALASGERSHWLNVLHALAISTNNNRITPIRHMTRFRPMRCSNGGIWKFENRNERETHKWRNDKMTRLILVYLFPNSCFPPFSPSSIPKYRSRHLAIYDLPKENSKCISLNMYCNEGSMLSVRKRGHSRIEGRILPRTVLLLWKHAVSWIFFLYAYNFEKSEW